MPKPTLGFCLWHKFRTAAFRRMPFVPVTGLAGSFTTKQEAQREREKLMRRKPIRGRWRQTYLGTDLSRWIGAGLYESYGAIRWNVPSILWVAILATMVLGLHTLFVAGADRWLEVFPTAIYDSLFVSPRRISGEEQVTYDLIPFWIGFLALQFVVRRAAGSMRVAQPAAVAPHQGHPHRAPRKEDPVGRGQRPSAVRARRRAWHRSGGLCTVAFDQIR